MYPRLQRPYYVVDDGTNSTETIRDWDLRFGNPVVSAIARLAVAMVCAFVASLFFRVYAEELFASALALAVATAVTATKAWKSHNVNYLTSRFQNLLRENLRAIEPPTFVMDSVRGRQSVIEEVVGFLRDNLDEIVEESVEEDVRDKIARRAFAVLFEPGEIIADDITLEIVNDYRKSVRENDLLAKSFVQVTYAKIVSTIECELLNNPKIPYTRPLPARILEMVDSAVFLVELFRAYKPTWSEEVLTDGDLADSSKL